jgi:predicted RNase H-like HicB family nuclease
MTFVEDRRTRTTQTAVESQQEGIWGETFTQIEGSRTVTFRKPIPMLLIKEYADFAVRQVNIEKTEDGTWFAQIPAMPGVWADEASIPEAVDVLREVVFDWVLVKIEAGDRDMPVINDIDLNSL